MLTQILRPQEERRWDQGKRGLLQDIWARVVAFYKWLDQVCPGSRREFEVKCHSSTTARDTEAWKRRQTLHGVVDQVLAFKMEGRHQIFLHLRGHLPRLLIICPCIALAIVLTRA